MRNDLIDFQGTSASASPVGLQIHDRHPAPREDRFDPPPPRRNAVLPRQRHLRRRRAYRMAQGCRSKREQRASLHLHVKSVLVVDFPTVLAIMCRLRAISDAQRSS